MQINENEIARLVQSVLAEMSGEAPRSCAPKAASGATPKTAKVAMLVEKGRFEVQEYPIPELGDDDILVKVEGCGICGTDAHE